MKSKYLVLIPIIVIIIVINLLVIPKNNYDYSDIKLYVRKDILEEKTNITLSNKEKKIDEFIDYLRVIGKETDNLKDAERLIKIFNENKELEQMEAQGTILPTARQVLPGNTLYLRIPSDSAISMITPVLQRSPGAVTVVLYIESTGAKLRAPQSLFVSPTQELIHNLSDMLGAKNVVLK